MPSEPRTLNFAFSRAARALLVTLAAGLMLGCATGPQANPKDPLEPFNRKVSVFNDALDDNVLQPVARGYRGYVPELVQTGVGNFFRNLADVGATVNNGLQLKGRAAAESLGRVLVNSVLGIYGIFDVASELGLQRYPEDFGQTLGYWGVPSGPYLVLPVLGPSSVRDSSVLSLDSALDPVRRHPDVPVRNTAFAVRVVDKRAALLPTTDLLAGAAMDRYSFTRDSFLQFRQNQVYDGNPPDEDSLVDPSAEPAPTSTAAPAATPATPAPAAAPAQ